MTDDQRTALINVRNCLDYLRKGGIAKEDAMQLAICEDVIDSILYGKDDE